MAGYVPLQIEQWSTFSRTITVKQADGTAQNLVGFVVTSQMRKSPYSTTAINLPAVLSDASNGEITLAETAANTGNIAAGRYLYDVISTAPTGLVQRLVEGIVVVNPGITRS
jgi:hypothetical protein